MDVRTTKQSREESALVAASTELARTMQAMAGREDERARIAMFAAMASEADWLARVEISKRLARTRPPAP